jgi:hypothetical protein
MKASAHGTWVGADVRIRSESHLSGPGVTWNANTQLLSASPRLACPELRNTGSQDLDRVLV